MTEIQAEIDVFVGRKLVHHRKLQLLHAFALLASGQQQVAFDQQLGDRIGPSKLRASTGRDFREVEGQARGTVDGRQGGLGEANIHAEVAEGEEEEEEVRRGKRRNDNLKVGRRKNR